VSVRQGRAGPYMMSFSKLTPPSWFQQPYRDYFHNLQYNSAGTQYTIPNGRIRSDKGKSVTKNEVFRVIKTVAVITESIKMILSYSDLQIKNDIARRYLHGT
jgi:hypothetical protein